MMAETLPYPEHATNSLVSSHHTYAVQLRAVLIQPKCFSVTYSNKYRMFDSQQDSEPRTESPRFMR
jgi:hypothetical protein